jgi:hypothetical protein
MWNKGDKLTLVLVLLTILLIIGSFLVPEVRKHFKLPTQEYKAKITGGDDDLSKQNQDRGVEGCGLGVRWDELEIGLVGNWVRRSGSNIFDANYPSIGVTSVNKVTVAGNQIYIDRIESSDGNRCTYQGTINPLTEIVAGTFSCRNGGLNSYAWHATIRCDGK